MCLSLGVGEPETFGKIYQSGDEYIVTQYRLITTKLGFIMTNDTVLLGGFGILILGSVIWFFARKLEDAKLSARAKRLAIYIMVAGFALSIMMVMKWHAQSYIDEQARFQYNLYEQDTIKIA